MASAWSHSSCYRTIDLSCLVLTPSVDCFKQAESYNTYVWAAQCIVGRSDWAGNVS